MPCALVLFADITEPCDYERDGTRVAFLLDFFKKVENICHVLLSLFLNENKLLGIRKSLYCIGKRAPLRKLVVAPCVIDVN